jgi:hypothetical protein
MYANLLKKIKKESSELGREQNKQVNSLSLGQTK